MGVWQKWQEWTRARARGAAHRTSPAERPTFPLTDRRVDARVAVLRLSSEADIRDVRMTFATVSLDAMSV